MKLFRLFLFVGVMAFACDLSAQTVYVTKTGEKYHKNTCHYLKNSKKEIDYKKAIELRYTACSVCKPNAQWSPLSIRSTSIKSTTSPTIKTTTSTQCTGKTKAGARCKRMTKSENGRCYQH
ncbi:hypothetical protein [Gelidibacter pelagius]|uniref:Uncharacterized protein n=1 Tax=Gelidibacter pelagius TaxID=2819985 RepID=A0ABS3SXZ4_9FLAO|nr:hypothetical protein [Gelidibacter pelagius]MBO3099607.1 hypothetical protein [Gelidibacter pelagius]